MRTLLLSSQIFYVGLENLTMKEKCRRWIAQVLNIPLKKSPWEDLQPHSGVKKCTQTKIQNRHKIHLSSYLDITTHHKGLWIPSFHVFQVYFASGEFGLILALWNYRVISATIFFLCVKKLFREKGHALFLLLELFANSKIFPNWVERASTTTVAKWSQ